MLEKMLAKSCNFLIPPSFPIRIIVPVEMSAIYAADLARSIETCGLARRDSIDDRAQERLGKATRA